MKKIFLIVLLFLSLQNIFAQKFERVKALKTAFITDRLELTPSEAEKFWPVYNLYEKELYQLQVIQRMELLNPVVAKGGVKSITEKEAADLLQQLLDLNDKVHHTEKSKVVALKKVISAQKILKLIKVEESFKRELFRMLQEHRNKKE